MPITYSTNRVDSEGESIYYELAGSDGNREAPVVVLTHGTARHHAFFFRQVPVLAERYRVLIWDSRGFGNSTNHGHTPTAEAAARDLAAVLDDAGIGSPVHLFGQTLGSWQAVEFALAAPHRVRSLVLCGATGSLFTEQLERHWTEISRRQAPPDLSAIPFDSHPALGGDTPLPEVYLFRQLEGLHDPPLAEVVPVLMHKRRAHSELAALGLPVLVLTGDQDPVFPPALLQDSAAQIPGAEFVVIDDAGHSPYFEQPDAFNTALLDFFSRVDDSSS